MSLSAIQQFDIFAQLVSSGNIITSARMLRLPAADVVDAMDRLEERLGCRLFAMNGNSVELTDTGHKLVTALGALSLEGQERWVTGLLAGDGDTENTGLDAGAEAEQDSRLAHPPAPQDEPPSLPIEAEAGSGGFSPLLPPLETAQTTVQAEDVADLAEEETAPLSPPDTPVEAIRPEPVRRILLASHPAIFSHFQEALVAFEEASPDIGITLRLDSLDARRVEELFAREEADIAYFYALEEPAHLNSRYAWSERISLFVAKDHPLAHKDAAQAEDLAHTPYVALASGNMARSHAEEALARCGLAVGPALLETDNLYEIMKQVQNHPCYFAAFGSMARDFGKMPGIARLNFSQGLPQVQVRQAVRPDLSNDPALLALAEFLFR